MSARPGDVVFFNGHVLHRSKANFTSDRYRRSFVGHFMNARSFTQWGRIVEPGEDTMAADVIDEATGGTNGSHILARGDTHLPFALPRFGTPCAALEPPDGAPAAQRVRAADPGARRLDAGLCGGDAGHRRLTCLAPGGASPGVTWTVPGTKERHRACRRRQAIARRRDVLDVPGAWNVAPGTVEAGYRSLTGDDPAPRRCAAQATAALSSRRGTSRRAGERSRRCRPLS